MIANAITEFLFHSWFTWLFGGFCVFVFVVKNVTLGMEADQAREASKRRAHFEALKAKKANTNRPGL